MAPPCVRVKHYNKQQQILLRFNDQNRRIFQQKETEAMFVGLPRRDCSVPSSVDAMSLSLSNPRPLSIHD